MGSSARKKKKRIQRTGKVPFGLLLVVLVGGLIARLWLLDVGSRSGYDWDHFDNISMGLGARQHGLLRIYSIQKDQVARVAGQVYRAGKFVPYERTPIFAPNYPPLTLTAFWVQTGCLPRPIKANTFAARVIMASFPFLAELVTAVGVALIAFRLVGRRAAFVSGALCWLLQPLALNSTFFVQIDSFVLAPSVFVVWFLIRRRWVPAGLTLALACLMKPQGLILGPIALFAAVLLPSAEGNTGFKRVLVRLIKLGAAFMLAVAVVTLPWTMTSGLEWANRTYVLSFLEAFPITTLKAFNVWYVDALILDAKMIPNALNSKAIVLSLTKDTWGRVFTFAAMFALGGLCWWRYRRSPTGLLVFSAMWLWSVFIFPTRVHERFIIYCVPLMLLVAFRLRRVWVGLALLLIVATAEHSWTVWLKGRPVWNFDPKGAYDGYMNSYRAKFANTPPALRPRAMGYSDFEQRYRRGYVDGREDAGPWEWVVTILSLLAYACTAVALFAIPPPADVLAKPPTRRR